jgi:hypothetical protein
MSCRMSCASDEKVGEYTHSLRVRMHSLPFVSLFRKVEEISKKYSGHIMCFPCFSRDYVSLTVKSLLGHPSTGPMTTLFSLTTQTSSDSV